MDPGTDSEMSDNDEITASPPTPLRRQNAVMSEKNASGAVVYTTRSHSPAGSVMTATDLGALIRAVEARRGV